MTAAARPRSRGSATAETRAVYPPDAREVGEIELRPRGQESTDRVAVMVRPVRARYEAWERAAGDMPVSTWLGELADAAVKRGR